MNSLGASHLLLRVLDQQLVGQDVMADFIDQTLVDCLALAISAAKEFRNSIQCLGHILNAHLEHHCCLNWLLEGLCSL